MEGESKDLKGVGLVSDHAYSVISVFEVKQEDQSLLRLLKLRNPWGHQEWSGDFSDKSSKWTPELRQEVGYKESNNGIFFITFEDYMNYYRSTTICRVHDGYHYTSISVDVAKYVSQKSKPYQIINISLKEKSKVFFSVV